MNEFKLLYQWDLNRPFKVYNDLNQSIFVPYTRLPKIEGLAWNECGEVNIFGLDMLFDFKLTVDTPLDHIVYKILEL